MPLSLSIFSLLSFNIKYGWVQKYVFLSVICSRSFKLHYFRLIYISWQEKQRSVLN